MARPGPFEEMFNLQIGEHMFIHPNSGEAVSKALSRIKMRASKYRVYERSYVVEIEGEKIRVARVPLGKNNKLRQFEEMKMGERKLLSEKPTHEDITSARNRVDYMHRTNRQMKQFSAQVIEGRLYLACVWDQETDNLMRERDRERERAERETPRGKLMDKIALYNLGIRFAQEEYNSGKSAGARGLKSVIDGFGERVEALERELAALDDEADGPCNRPGCGRGNGVTNKPD